MNKSKLLLLLLFILGVQASNVWAQGTATNATIAGIITDIEGNSLPGATVIAKHVPSGTIFGSSTRVDGRYTLQNVKVGGPYELTVSFVGYEKYSYTIEYLKLGQFYNLDIKLAQSAVQMKELIVMGEKDPILNSGKTGSATNVAKEQIEKLPTISRSFQDFSKLSPMFSGSNLSAGGRNAKLNNIQLDGTQYNDLFGLGDKGTPGGQANTNPISLDAIQEFQIVLAPYDIRQSGFTGGGINAITRSGTNTLEGSAYYYNRNENFVGKSPDAAQTKYNKFSEYQTGFRVGGPIMTDQLFFFTSFEKTKREYPLEQSQFKTANGPKLDSLSNVIKNFLVDSLHYNPGTLNPYTTNRPTTKFFVRFDYNLAQNHTLTLRHNLVSADDDILVRSDRLSFDDRVYTFKNTTNSTVLQLNSTFRNDMSNEFILGYTAIRDKRTVNNKFPSIRIQNLVIGLDAWAGTEEFSIANKLDQDIFEFTDNFSYFLGDHVFTVGTHNEFYSFTNLFIRNYYGLYTFSSVSNFLARNPSSYAVRYSTTGDPMQAAEFSARQYGFYVQDEWSAMPGLKLTLGLRVDVPVLPDKPKYNIIVDTCFRALGGYETNDVPSGKLLFSPRFGFNWDVFNNKETIVRGGIGIFTGRIPYVWISNQYANTGVEFADISATFGRTLPAFFVVNPDSQPHAGQKGLSASKQSEINLTDKDFKMPQMFRINVGGDQKLPMNLVASADFLYSKTLNDMVYQDINIGVAKGSLLDGRPTYGIPTDTSSFASTSRVNSTYFSRVMLLKNTSDGYQTNLSLQVQGDPIPGLNVNLGYAMGRAKDQNSVTSSQAQSQFRYNPIPGNPNNPPLTTSNYEIKNRIFLSLGYTYEFYPNYKTTLTIFYNGQTGRPFSYRYSNDANGDGNDANDLIYIPSGQGAADDYLFGTTSKPTNNKTVFTESATMSNLFWAYVQRDNYMKDHKGRIMERNATTEPWFDNVDLRLSQTIPTVFGQSLEISLDILNVGNLLKSNWGRIYQVPNQTDALLTYQGVYNGTDATKKGKVQVTYTDKWNPFIANDLLSRWQMQLGVRYNF